MRRNCRMLLVTGLAAAGLLVSPASAATPSASTIGASKPSVSWSGKTTLPAGAVYCVSSDDPVCDNFFLEATSNGQVVVDLTGSGTDDWDLVVYDDDGALITSSSSDGNTEQVTFPVVEGGRYEIDAAPFLALSGKAYQAVAAWSA